jgi:hypothetical protein
MPRTRKPYVVPFSEEQLASLDPSVAAMMRQIGAVEAPPALGIATSAPPVAVTRDQLLEIARSGESPATTTPVPAKANTHTHAIGSGHLGLIHI